MVWYNGTGTPSNPAAIWGADAFDGVGGLQDRIGSNHLNLRGGSSAVNFSALAKGVKGTGVLLSLSSAISTSGSKTFFYMGVCGTEGGSSSGDIIPFSSGSGNKSILLAVLPGSGISATKIVNRIGPWPGGNESVGAAAIDLTALFFLALTTDGTTARCYANGDWFGDSFNPSAYIDPNISTLASWNEETSPYNLNNKDLLCCAGVYDSVATVAQLQTLEAAARVAFFFDANTLNTRATNAHAQRQALLASVPHDYYSALKNPVFASVPTGAGVVIGSVAEKSSPPAPNTPVVRRVVCIDEATGVQVGSTWSATDGSYAFGGLDPSRRVTVLAYDHTDHYRAVVADKLLPVLP